MRISKKFFLKYKNNVDKILNQGMIFLDKVNHDHLVEIYKQVPKSNFFPKISHYYEHKKIRLGYFSGDFRNHPVAFLTAELYELHDRTKFEIHAFSFGPDENDKFKLKS